MNDQGFQRAKRRNDLIAKWVITSFGLTTIFSVLAIIIVVLLELLPLFSGSELIQEANLNSESDIVMASQGPWLEKAWTLSKDGMVSVHDLNSDSAPSIIPLRPDEKKEIIHADHGIDGFTTLTWNDQTVTRTNLSFRPNYDQAGQRSIQLKSLNPSDHQFTSPHPLKYCLSRSDENGNVLFLGIKQDSRVVGKKFLQQNTPAEESTQKNLAITLSENDVLFIDANPTGQTIFTLSRKGLLSMWDVSEKIIIKAALQLDLDRRDPTGLASLIGTDEVAITYSSGEIEVVSLASHDGGPLKPTLIRKSQVSSHPIIKIQSSPRNRTLFLQNSQHQVIAWHTTNQRTLLEQTSPLRYGNITIAPRGKGITLWSPNGDLIINRWKSPHPEAGIGAFFHQIWYAGYPAPDYIWQSSSGSDDFEPKISLIPLILGTIKGSIYAMIFSVPLAVLAALYTSVFASNKIKNFIKPLLEMMSAIPSVVVGLLAALWLAPLIDNNLLSIFIALPLTLLSLLCLPSLVGKLLGKDAVYSRSYLVLISAGITILLSGYASSWLASAIETSGLFEDSFRTWFLQSVLPGDYDIRNCLVISVALGFAVIPIIYSISEDSLSSVPKELSSASLALGATPWQTAWNVVLPAASPGIVAAITLGLGRAVGETMIVLMATGNTPIMDLNVFEGFRALSANIAVEMPEAPVGGTLYRTLFLAAAILLVFTSILNMITETIRHRLARKLANL